MLGDIKHLYSTVVDSKHKWKIISIIPEFPENFTACFLSHSEGDTLEIAFTKKSLLRLFKSSHSYWHEQVLSKDMDFEELARTAENSLLWDLYYMTLGYLITTNENHTLIRLHEVVVYELYSREGDIFIEKEFEIITTFLSSRFKRINKSSSLWFWTKKLTIILILQRFVEGKDVRAFHECLVDRTFKSCQFHFANYYACNFLRWYLAMLAIVEDTERVRSIEDQVLTSCHQNFRDVSLWGLLETLITRGSKSLEFMALHYNTIVRSLPTKDGRSYPEFAATDKQAAEPYNINIEHEISWLLSADCSFRTPYVSLLRPFEPNGNREVWRRIESLLVTKLEDESEQLARFEDHSSEHYRKKKELYETLDYVIEEYFE
ncbi:hypothetical protein G9P44_000298 [Scheffersomyces stipitis]|nr:hypothetical protein G9P44_000298 [Scheffersomyces stipitis]